MSIAFKRTGNSALATLEGNIVDALGQLGAGSPLTGALVLANVTLTAGKDNAVPHKLGKAATGYLVIKANAATTVFDSSASNPIPDKQLLLRASSTAKVSLLVF